jgi:hypothetical protein
MSTTSVTLPAEFADLEPFADWALPTEGERYAKRIASTMDELQAFYDAAFPRSEAAATYLDQFPMDARHCCIELARRLPDGREASDGRFARPVIGRLLRFAHTIRLAGSRRCVRFASNATVPAPSISRDRLTGEPRDRTVSGYSRLERCPRSSGFD